MKLRLQYPPSPENAARLAQIAVDTVKKIDRIDLDYSPASLSKVDSILETFHREGLDQSQIGETVFSLGCYVGEVLVRNNGGTWKLPKDSFLAKLVRRGENIMVVDLPNGTTCNPIGKAFKFLENGRTDSVAYFYQVFTKDAG